MTFSNLRLRFRPSCYWICILLAARAGGQVSVGTYRNNNLRNGQNPQETILTLSNVNSEKFGRLFTISVDGKVDAQPLYVSKLTVNGATHNVLYVATENDSVYAFDADKGTLLWHVSVAPSGETASDNRGCSQVTPTIGVTSTPVVDLTIGAHGTIYAVAMTKDSSGGYHQRLHALDLTTGAEELGGPVEVQATYPGTGDNSSGGVVTFDPKQYKERAALLDFLGIIYTGWASHCDNSPYTGWVIGYFRDSLKQARVLNLTPNGHEGAIWMSGSGLASTGEDIYVLMANGTFDTTLNAEGFPVNHDYGNAAVAIASNSNHQLSVAGYFTMMNTSSESGSDTDFGSGGIVLLPDMAGASGVKHLLMAAAGKDSNLYIIDANNMGKYSPKANNIYQELPSAFCCGVYSSPAYFQDYLYYGAVAEPIEAFLFHNGKFESTPTSETPETYPYPGATPAISANWTENAILWAVSNTNPAVLYAYDALNLSKELYNSNQAANGRDHFGAGNKFITPTVVNGKVYVATTNGVGVFGLLP